MGKDIFEKILKKKPPNNIWVNINNVETNSNTPYIFGLGYIESRSKSENCDTYLTLEIHIPTRFKQKFISKIPF